MQTKTYPDGEMVTFHYNAAGKVESLTSNKQGRANGPFSDIHFSGKTTTKDGLKILRDIIRPNNKVIDIEANGTKTVNDKVSGCGFNISRKGKFNGFRVFKERTK